MTIKRQTKCKNKRKTGKRHSGKKRGGGCSCSNSHLFSKMSGGGDFFNGGNVEPASFNNVPMRSFYSHNQYESGTDVQGGQLSSRLEPQLSTTPRLMGGKKNKSRKLRNKKRNCKGKKVKGGGLENVPGSMINSFSDPLTAGNRNLSNSIGNTSGSLMSPNLLKGVLV
jgi:hypothetical protein